MWYVIILIIILMVTFIWLGRRPVYHRNIKSEEFEKYLRALLSECADGSLMFIDHEGSERFLQFAKYRSNQGQTILHFGFPDAPWSRQYFESIVKLFQTSGITYNITPGEGLVQRFLQTDLTTEDPKKAITTAAFIARATFGAMGLSESSRFKIHYRGNLSREAIRPSLETLSEQPSKTARTLSQYYLKKLDAKARRAKKGKGN